MMIPVVTRGISITCIEPSIENWIGSAAVTEEKLIILLAIPPKAKPSTIIAPESIKPMKVRMKEESVLDASGPPAPAAIAIKENGAMIRGFTSRLKAVMRIIMEQASTTMKKRMAKKKPIIVASASSPQVLQAPED